MFETGVVRANECYKHSTRSGGIIETPFRFFFTMKVCCVSSIELPHRGHSNEYTQYTIFNVKKGKLP